MDRPKQLSLFGWARRAEAAPATTTQLTIADKRRILHVAQVMQMNPRYGTPSRAAGKPGAVAADTHQDRAGALSEAPTRAEERMATTFDASEPSIALRLHLILACCRAVNLERQKWPNRRSSSTSLSSPWPPQRRPDGSLLPSRPAKHWRFPYCGCFRSLGTKATKKARKLREARK
jgi:hypothetical protein